MDECLADTTIHHDYRDTVTLLVKPWLENARDVPDAALSEYKRRIAGA